MKLNIILLISLIFFLGSNVIAQTQRAGISFDKEVHNFEKVKEEDGPVTCTFEVTNTGAEPLIISNVKPSCGCTAPDWTKTPIGPGKSGNVKATYNPRNRPGKFNKTLTVMSNSETPTKVLRIQGEVIPRPKSITDLFPQLMANLRLKSNHIAFVKIKNTEVKTDSVLILNDGFEDMKISFDRVPEHIEMHAEPEILKPKQKGLIVATYDATKHKTSKGEQEWGFIIDRINVIINENNDPRHRLSVSATIEEDFSWMTEEDKANAPIASFDGTVFNFDKIVEGESVKHEFKFTNKGKSNLEIRKIKSSCGCTVTDPADLIIEPGKSSTIGATFNSQGKLGRQNKTITVITNDPKNNNIRLRITGEVSKQ